MDLKDEGYSIMELPKPVYYIESSSDNTVLVGIGVTIEQMVKDGKKEVLISWYDTDHERAMRVDEAKLEGDDLIIRRVMEGDGGIYRFTPMNLEIYYAKVKDHLTNGKDYNNEEDLIKAFLRTTRCGL